MTSWLTRTSLRNRLLVGLMAGIVALFGVIATTNLNQELVPDTTYPSVSVQGALPGASPDIVEETVTTPLETALDGITGVDTVSTTTTSGAVSAMVSWDFAEDYDEMFGAVRTAVDGVRAELPADAMLETYGSSLDDVPVVVFAIADSAAGDEASGDDADTAALGERVENVLVPELEAVSGVSDVQVGGLVEEEVRLSFRPDDVEEHEVTVSAVAQELEAAGVVVPGGQTTVDERTLAIEVGSSLSSVEDVADVPLRTADGTVRLGDVAYVSLAPVESQSITRANGQDALTVSVLKDSEANVVDVSHGVTEAIDRVKADLGGGVETTILLDQAPFIEQSVHNLAVEGGLGLVFAILVILFFLASFRSTVVAAISIPLSLLVALIGLSLGGLTLNMLTLGALTIAVGRVVDDSIVVIENIRRRQGTRALTADDIVASVRQVAGAITSSTLTTVAVFLPIAFVAGEVGELFRPFAVTVTLALLASLLVALTIVPVVSYWFLREAPRPLSPEKLAKLEAKDRAFIERQEAAAERRRARRQSRIDAKNTKRAAKGLPPLPAATAEAPLRPGTGGESADPVDGLQRAFMPPIRAALRRPWATLGVSAVLVLVTGVLATGLRTDFLGDTGQNLVSVTQELPVGTSLAASSDKAALIEEVIAADPDVESTVTSVSAGSGSAVNSFTVTLVEDADVAEVTARLQTALDGLEDAGEVLAGFGTGQQDVEIAIAGTDPAALAEAADLLTEKVAELEGVQSATNDLSADQPVVRIAVDRAAAAEVGYSQAEVGAAVAQSLAGSPIGTLTLEGKERNIVIAPEVSNPSVEEIAALALPVTQVQTAHAQEEAQDAITEEQDAISEEAQAEAEEQQQEAIEAAEDGAEQAREQLDEARSALEEAQNPSAAPAVPDPAQMAAEQIAQLEEAVAAAEDGVEAADEQVDDLYAAQEKAAEDRATQERLTEQSEAIPDITGEAVTVGDIAEVTEENVPAAINRDDGVRQVTVLATPEDQMLGVVSVGVQQLIADTDLPDGVTFSVGGASAAQQEAFTQLGISMLLAIVLVLLVMIATFRSFVQPLVLLASIPLAATGAVVLLVVTGIPLGIPALIGLLMLIGIVVTNAIVLIDLVNHLRADGLPLEDALLHGTRLRLRPILMTAAATVFALLPMAFGLTGGGLFISQPLAIVVIGGLTSSTLLTLVVVPVLYELVERRKETLAARREEKRAAKQARREAEQERPVAEVGAQ
ncbi:efflux RND transporter permease subunit [Brevibacterium samyangense]|uniref:Hydrophobic/amphiphilic exporter-1, HAE1 family n=1 Tax=Brevibacterium samyangense TaxID=366888 RepID=A0ABP5EGP1_9MICO